MLAADTHDQKVRIHKRPNFWHGGKAYWQKVTAYYNSMFRQWSPNDGEELEPPVRPYCHVNLE
jgi:hypothetical protein